MEFWTTRVGINCEDDEEKDAVQTAGCSDEFWKLGFALLQQ